MKCDWKYVKHEKGMYIENIPIENTSAGTMSKRAMSIEMWSFFFSEELGPKF